MFSVILISLLGVNKIETKGLDLMTTQMTEAGSLLLERDGVWEEMVRQAWADYINTINREKELYGVKIEPLELSPILGNRIKLSQSLLGYQVNLTFGNIWVHGLSGLRLKDVTFKRDKLLNKVRTYAVLTASELDLDGWYSMAGEGEGVWSWVGASSISSEGEQKFMINMKNAEIICELHVDLVTGCSDNKDRESPVVTKINFPMDYETVKFDFQNIGPVLGTAVDIIGRIVIDSEKEALIAIIREGIARESPGLICDTWKEIEEGLPYSSRYHFQDTDQEWNAILSRVGGNLQRDRLAELTVQKVFEESILTHLNNVSSPLRQTVDPLPLFPLEFDFKNDVYKAKVEACDVYAHNFRSVNNLDMMLVRDESLNFSALRVTVELPIAWMSGKYKLKSAYFLGFIPAGAGGHFNVDIKRIKARMIVVLRKTEQGLVLEHFTVDSQWEDVTFLFDGLWSGWGELADLVMNELGVGGVIVDKQKKYVMDEIKSYMRGMAVCAMWEPAAGLQLCMRQYWIDLGWAYPWVYPTC